MKCSSVLLVWTFSRVGLLKRRPSFQPPVVMVQVSGGRGWRGGEAADVRGWPGYKPRSAPEYSLRPRPGGCRHAEAGPRTPRPRQRLHPAPARPPHGEDTTWQRISSQFVALYSSVDNRYCIVPVGAVPRRPPEPAGAGAPRPQRAGQPGPGAGDGGWPRAGVCPV